MRWRFWYWFMSLSTLPTFLLFLPVMIFAYGVKSWRWRDRCFEFVARTNGEGETRIWGKPGAQCWGTFAIVYASDRAAASGELAVHERVHAVHGFILNTIGLALCSPLAYFFGWPWLLLGCAFFPVAYGAHFFARWIFRADPWFAAYLGIWSERLAYDADARWSKDPMLPYWGAR